MIQRIQTLYLSLAIVALILLFFFPMASFLSDLEYLKFYVTGVKNMVPDGVVPVSFTYTLPMVIAVIAIAALAGTSIALYRNRTKQIQMTNIAVMLNILFILAVLFIYIPLVKKRTGIEPDTTMIGIYLPVISLMFLVLANRAIKRDDKLVRSIDRLR